MLEFAHVTVVSETALLSRFFRLLANAYLSLGNINLENVHFCNYENE
jgi:hypothetical protein